MRDCRYLFHVAADYRLWASHPDEIYQTQEQAHRLVYGYGIVPWEFRDGVRSWILPGLLALELQTAHEESLRLNRLYFFS